MGRSCRLVALSVGLLVAACGPTATDRRPPASGAPTADGRPPTADPARTQSPVPTVTPVSSAAPSPTAAPPTPTATPSPVPSATPCAQPGRIEHGTVESAVAGEPMRYRVYLPPCYGADGRVYPALYMFGGNIHDDAIWDGLGLDEAAEQLIARGDIPPLLIVMPDNGWLANTTTSGPGSYEGFVLSELIPHIEAAYCAWPERGGRAVGGLSRGGYWSLMMAFRRPDLFRSVGAHSPALIDSYAGPAEDPVITGGTNDLAGLRIRVDIGERDPYLGDARPLHDTLTAAGAAHEWRVGPGTHDEAYWRENLATYLSWYGDGWRVDRAALPDCPRP